MSEWQREWWVHPGREVSGPELDDDVEVVPKAEAEEKIAETAQNERLKRVSGIRAELEVYREEGRQQERERIREVLNEELPEMIDPDGRWDPHYDQPPRLTGEHRLAAIDAALSTPQPEEGE